MHRLELDPDVENVVSDCVEALFDECVKRGATRLRVLASNATFVDDDGNPVDYGDWVLELSQVRKPVPKILDGQLELPFEVTG